MFQILRVSNSEVPKMYGLCKIHKEGEKMRKIVSNVKSPLVKIARWLVCELKKLMVSPLKIRTNLLKKSKT